MTTRHKQIHQGEPALEKKRVLPFKYFSASCCFIVHFKSALGEKYTKNELTIFVGEIRYD